MKIHVAHIVDRHWTSFMLIAQTDEALVDQLRNVYMDGLMESEELDRLKNAPLEDVIDIIRQQNPDDSIDTDVLDAPWAQEVKA